MGIDNRGKEGVNKPTTRAGENKPGGVTKTVNETKDKVSKILKKK